MSIVYWDVETFSRCKLKDCGAHVYAADPNTGVFFVCFAIDDSEVQTWRPDDPVPAVFAAPTSHTFVSDNWTFERLILKHKLVLQHGFAPLTLEQQDCAQRKALASAFPPELGLRAEALGLPYRKDLTARRAMLRLARMHEYKDPATRERDLELLWQRCRSDVAMTRAAYNHPRLRPLPSEEREQLLLDAAINDRGIGANVPFLTAVMTLAGAELDAANLRIAELTGGTVTSVNQPIKLRKAINAQGHNLKTLGKRAVAAALAHKPEALARELLELRQRGAHASGRMAKRLLAHAAPGRPPHSRRAPIPRQRDREVVLARCAVAQHFAQRRRALGGPGQRRLGRRPRRARALRRPDQGGHPIVAGGAVRGSGKRADLRRPGRHRVADPRLVR